MPISILHLEEGLSVCHAELGDHCTSSEHHPVCPDVVAVGPLEDPPVLEGPVEGLVAGPCI